MFSATDDFNRADVNPVGGNWVTCTGSNNAKILSNQLASTSISSYVYYNAVTADDQYSECVQAINTGGPAVRLVTTSRDGYFYHVPFAILYSRVSGVANNILSTGDTPSTTAVYKLEAIGSTLTVYKDGVSIGSVVNTDFSSGKTGIYINASACRIDNWAGGDAGISVTADNLAQANSSTTGAIGQEHVITAQNSTQVNESTSGGLLGFLTADSSTQVNESTPGSIDQAYVLWADGSNQVNASSTSQIAQSQIIAALDSIQVNLSGTGQMLPVPGYWYEEAAEILNWDDITVVSTTWTDSPPITSNWS